MSGMRASGEECPDIRTACCAGCEAPFDATANLQWRRVHAVIEELHVRGSMIVRYWHPRCYGRRQHFLPQPIGARR